MVPTVKTMWDHILSDIGALMYFCALALVLICLTHEIKEYFKKDL